MSVDDRPDVLERAVASQVQEQLGSGAAALGTGHDLALGTDYDQVLDAHGLVIDRRRCADDGPVGLAGRNIAGGAFDEPAAQQLLGRGQDDFMRIFNSSHSHLLDVALGD